MTLLRVNLFGKSLFSEQNTKLKLNPEPGNVSTERRALLDIIM